MKLSVLIKYPKPTAEMVDNFINRTALHTGLVSKNLSYFIEHYESLEEPEDKMMWELIHRSKTHDASKYEEPEYTPYLWLTEFHRCKNLGIPFEYPPGVEAEVKQATWHHIHHNSHHPEYHADINKMPLVDILEMICDWTGMAEELGEGTSAKPWATKVVGHKFKFDDHQKKIIFDNIELLDKLKS